MKKLCDDDKCSGKCSSKGRRNFLMLSISSGLLGAGFFVSRLFNNVKKTTRKPDDKTLSLEFDLNSLKPGDLKVIEWNKKPIFIKHRTEDEIKLAKEKLTDGMIDPQYDEERVLQDPRYLVMYSTCTHLGCITREYKNPANKDVMWICPCHGSTFDCSGRVLKGPASKNLKIPPYKINNNILIFGSENATK